MDRAEQRALEKYPYAEMCREKYLEGYRQAEKDLELTWEDIDWIVGEAVCRVSEDSVAEQICKEVLKRFKDYRERKENENKRI